MKTYLECKQEVAKRHGYETWNAYYLAVQGTKYEYLANEEVFEIGCNESAKSDREKVLEHDPLSHKYLPDMGCNFYFIDADFVRSLPLPFPELT
jgi:hypothetical protein